MSKTVFEKIIDGEIETEILYENSDVIVIDDIQPQAPVHVLIITREKILDIETMDPAIFSSIHNAIVQTVRLKGIEETGYRVVTNVGKNGGQSVPHLHFHVLGGKRLNSRIG